MSQPNPKQPQAQQYQIINKTVPTFLFVGVTTGKSSIRRVFPLWMKEFGRPEIVLEGVDCKIHDSPEVYRQVVAQIKYDPGTVGGLVTTHKIDLLNAVRDMFDYLDPYAQICGEVSSISKLDRRLEGHARDPISSGLSLDAIIGEGYFGRTGGEVLCFGAGGSAVATLLHLINKQDPADRPQRFVMVNRSQGRLDGTRVMVESQKTDIQVELIHNSDHCVNDALMAKMPEASLVINATGMGKDTPGSPITNAGLFPRRGIAWEFNYRGELDFMHQALAQRERRELTVEDGWLYFIYGWALVIAQVLHVQVGQEMITKLKTVAETVR
jgi:shikimate dehydrogenase